jgi:DNA-binding XRE family transcriptional regulator
MSRRPANVTQADVARAIRAARQTGAGTVDVLPDGTIRISLAPAVGNPPVPVEPRPKVVL